MEAESFQREVSRETAALGERPTAAEVRSAVARLEALDPPSTVSQWRSGLMLLEGLAEMGWPHAPEMSADEQASLDTFLRSTPE